MWDATPEITRAVTTAQEQHQSFGGFNRQGLFDPRQLPAAEHVFIQSSGLLYVNHFPGVPDTPQRWGQVNLDLVVFIKNSSQTANVVEMIVRDEHFVDFSGIDFQLPQVVQQNFSVGTGIEQNFFAGHLDVTGKSPIGNQVFPGAGVVVNDGCFQFRPLSMKQIPGGIFSPRNSHYYPSTSCFLCTLFMQPFP